MIRHRGFSLVEYILYIGISTLILVAMLQSSLLLIRTRDKHSNVQPVQEELRFTSRMMTRAIRNATAINADSSTFGSANGILSLTMSDASLSPTVFSLQNGLIFMAEGSAAPFALTSSKIIVEQLQLANLSATGTTGTIKLNLIARSALTGATLSLETTTSLRQ